MSDQTSLPPDAGMEPPREGDYVAQDKPEPVVTVGGVITGLATVAFVTATGVLILPALGVFGHTSGAARSARIEWQDRQAEIAEVIAEKQVTTQEEGGTR